MPFEHQWYIENRVYFVRAWGELPLEEIAEFNMLVMDILENSEDTIHLLMDIRDLEKVPNNLSAMKRNLEILRHPRLGWNIHIANSGNSFVNLAASFIADFFQVFYRRFTTYQEAVDFLKEADDSLDWSKIIDPPLTRKA